ncbi:bestrophin family protein [Ensifer sp. ENS07]|jgi:putative membrane protein|uniref:Bestrophin family protein n=1 Tax=Ensifer adhaerens TaxID=106592 RepID=A0A9Q9DAH3_ENSAD|nr:MULTISPECIES: bestrophin family protein [Ensifer]KQX59801.1 bestrophin [Ensifer sp. Root1298]KQX93358.1 bestrophin [Ensifer sp. Root1312]KRC14110.1 bestrophin [Ensifer sp. Root74]KRD68501.1 bestrophin [Ensifer sp. Root954]MBD9493236.1 bestrophin family protein [Ensifer sp. ENS01]
MIVRNRPTLLKLFFILRGSVIQRIFPQVLFVFALSAFVVWAHRVDPGLVPSVSSGPFALLGIALSVFLGFRNNACYDRWWEARKDWGQLIFTARDLARQTLILAGTERQRLLDITIAFGHALVCHLRPGSDVGRPLARLPTDLVAGYKASRNGPDFLLREMGGILAGLHGTGTISDFQWAQLDGTLGKMSAMLAACERIRNTPVPFGYTLLLHRTAYLFCFLLPFGFADALGWATPFVTALVAYTFFGLDALGDELEEPFGVLPNDLPIVALAETIEINLREALGETNLPPLPQPKNYILM